MMKRLLFIFTLLSFSLISCQVDELAVDNPVSRNEKGFSLSYRVSGAYSALTKSVVDLEEGEDNINSFYILFFESTTGGTGTFIEAIDINPGNESLLSTGVIDIVFPENSGLNGTTNYNLLLCANIYEYTKGKIGSVEELKAASYGLTENEVIRTLIEIEGVDPTGRDTETAKIAEQEDNTHEMDMSNLPMSASAVKYAGESELKVDLVRVVSRFDVVCSIEGFTLVSASIWNAYTTSTIGETVFKNFSGIRTQRYYGVQPKDNSNQITGSLYAFENYVKAPAPNDKQSTCLIVGLLRDGRSKVEYFRININSTDMGQQLKRNNSYRTIIKRINSKGDDTERDAYENPERLTEYLIITPDTFPEFSAGGGVTDVITVFASGSWSAEVNSEVNTEGYFEELDNEEDGAEDENNENENTTEPPLVKKWKSANGNSFYLGLTTVATLSNPGSAKVTFKLDGTNITETISLSQRALSTEDVVVQVRRKDRVGSLFDLKKAVTHSYVYNMATNMRNTNLFGAQATVEMGTGYVFLYTGSLSKYVREEAKIYQVTGNPAAAVFNKLRTNMDTGKLKLIIMCNHDSYAESAMKKYITAFKSGYHVNDYTVSTKAISGDAKLERRFAANPDMDKKLIQYLLEEGPFGKVDHEKLAFKSRSAVDRALTKWPDTFIPLIMAGKNNEYCVLGIDPTNRLIWMSDPGIFGSKPTSGYQNNSNFNPTLYPDNEKFMNNFIGWMSEVVVKGDTFLNDFK